MCISAEVLVLAVMRIHWKISICLIVYATCSFAQTTGTSTITSTDFTSPITESTSSTTLTSSTSPKDELTLSGSETANPKPLEIVKQIRRVNADGSYTFGYEAEDGTFKIESRDVLGNVKGTFGFIDDAGEIKRVSYSANNQTSLKSTPSPKEDIGVQLAPRVNRSSVLSATTRRPHTSLVYSHVTTTPLPTRQTVIQAIPRRRIQLPSIVSSTTASPDSPRPIYGHFVTSKDSSTISTTPSGRDRPLSAIYSTTTPSRPVVIIRPTTQVNIQRPLSEGQLDRPDDAEITTAKAEILPTPTRRVHTIRRPSEKTIDVSTTQKPVYETLNKKVEDEISRKSVRGNSLRRQLNQDKDVQFEAQEQILNYHQSSGDDSTDIYGGGITTGNPRLLFTTTASPPRPISSILSARNRQFAHYTSPQSTSTVREYIRQPQRLPAEPTIDPTTETTNVLTENPIPVLQIPVHNGQYINLQRQRPIPINGINQFRTREYLREHPGAPIPIGNQRPEYRVLPEMLQEERGQYLRETSAPNLVRAATQGQYQADDGTTGPVQYRGPIRRPAPIDERDYMHNSVTPYPDYQPYSTGYRPVPYQYANDDVSRLGMPLTTRDFQRLLSQIINRHRYGQNYNPNPYYPNPGYSQYNQYQRPYYDNQNGPVSFDPQSNRPYPMYRQVPTRQQLLEQEAYGNSEQQYDHRFAPRRRIPYRQRLPLPYSQDPQDSYEQTNVFLPPEVREALLLRMLMLAISPDGPIPAPSNNEVTTTSPPFLKKKPVRSVQILGEEPPTRTKRYEEEMVYGQSANY